MAQNIPAQCKGPDNGASYVKGVVDIINGYANLYSSIRDNSSEAGDLEVKQLNNLYRSLTKQKMDLTHQIQQLTSSTERHDRDFVDLEESTTPSTSSLLVLDDYTLWVLLLSYLIMAFAIVFLYANINNYTIKSMLIGVGGMTIVSFFLIVLAIIVL
jgi:hypothetical protein